MTLTSAQTAEALKKFGNHDKDTGSPAAQISLLTERMTYLNEHFKTNPKDHHSRTGLMKMVSKRRRLLTYLQRRDPEAYKKLIAGLGIRK
jgi:small subunit ribosomal protein S15